MRHGRRRDHGLQQRVRLPRARWRSAGAAIACTPRMRNPDKGDLAKVLSDEGLDAEVLQLDVDDDASVRSGIGQVLEREGTVDVLDQQRRLRRHRRQRSRSRTDEAWQAIISTNLLGPLRCARAVLPSMRERGAGTIVNVSSIAGRMYGMPFTVVVLGHQARASAR